MIDMYAYDLVVATDLGVYRETIEASSFNKALKRANEAVANWTRVAKVERWSLIQQGEGPSVLRVLPR